MGRTFLTFGAVFAFLTVALGAFGAHGLRDRLSAESMAVYQTGIQYQGMHALALLVVGGLLHLIPGMKKLRPAGWLFVAGVFIFSGSLYVLALTGTRWLGAITPLGGVCFLLGWGFVTWAVAVSLPEDSRSS